MRLHDCFWLQIHFFAQKQTGELKLRRAECYACPRHSVLNECLQIPINDPTRSNNVYESEIACYQLGVMELVEHINHTKPFGNYFKNQHSLCNLIVFC